METVTRNGFPLHWVDLKASDGGRADIFIHRSTLKPYQLLYYNLHGDITREINYTGQCSLVDDKKNGECIEYNYNQKNIYDLNTFFHLFRGYPWGKKEVQFWSFLPDIHRSFLLFVKPVGEEDMEFMGQKVKAIKLEMGAAGFIESVLFPQTFNFWIGKKSPHIFLKFEGKDLKGKSQFTKTVFYQDLSSNYVSYIISKNENTSPE